MEKILFVCVENSCRSQIAAGFANFYGRGKVEAYSAGSKPGREINPDAIKVMREAGVDISTAEPKGFNDLKEIKFDYAVSMGCKDTCPFVPAEKHIYWQVEDPKGKDINFIRKKVEQLINEV
jgi:protein-tyrosine-phosphatase